MANILKPSSVENKSVYISDHPNIKLVDWKMYLTKRIYREKGMDA